MAEEIFGDDGDVAVFFGGSAGYLPSYCGSVFRNAAENLAVEGFDDFGAALIPPHFRGGDRFAVVQLQRVGKILWRSDLGLVIVRGIGGVGVAVRTAAERSDVEKVHEALMILFGGQVHGAGQAFGDLLCLRLAVGREKWNGSQQDEAQKPLH